MFKFVFYCQVYDVTKFLEDHPGGDDVLISSTGITGIKFISFLFYIYLVMFLFVTS
jgi:Cytochrome b5-like Heme/Steroid binding domain